jgi:hypothetical protein
MADVPATVELSITSTSQVISNPNQPATLPKITMNGNPFPQPQQPGWATGFQVVVLNAAMDMTNPAAIISNRLIPVTGQGTNWMSSYQWAYDAIVFQLLTSGNINQQLVFIASFGLDANMSPTTGALQWLIDTGAGPVVQDWVTHVDRGSEGGSWTQQPANYILVGYSSQNYGQGNEKFQKQWGGNPLSTNLTVTLQNVVPPPEPAAKAEAAPADA